MQSFFVSVHDKSAKLQLSHRPFVLISARYPLIIKVRPSLWFTGKSGSRDSGPAASTSENSDPLYLQNGKPHIPTSLFRPFEKLPYDGQTLTPEEEGCDPETSRCKTKIHVWEVRCDTCQGTGTVVSSSRHRRRTLATCLQCTGLGYVRHTSSQVEPVKESADCEEYYTLGRPQPPITRQDKHEPNMQPPGAQQARGRRREPHKH